MATIEVILDFCRNNFSYILSKSYPDVPNQVSSQLAF